MYLQIAVVAVMCKPHRCPHISMTGNICVYCPGGPDSDFEYSTQSYTGYEPTSMRAIRARYNPYLQTRHRIEQVWMEMIHGQKMQFWWIIFLHSVDPLLLHCGYVHEKCHMYLIHLKNYWRLNVLDPNLTRYTLYKTWRRMTSQNNRVMLLCCYHMTY